MCCCSQVGLAVGDFHTGSAGRVPTTERVSGKNALSTGPVEGAVGSWNPHHTLWCANIYHALPESDQTHGTVTSELAPALPQDVTMRERHSFFKALFAISASFTRSCSGLLCVTRRPGGLASDWDAEGSPDSQSIPHIRCASTVDWMLCFSVYLGYGELQVLNSLRLLKNLDLLNDVGPAVQQHCFV